ncbi:MAG: cellulose biosynthesis protein BcsS [Hyphomicrobium sp.]
MLAGTLAAALAIAASAPAMAGNPSEPAQPEYGWREMWGGADATKDVWLLYTGVTLAPFSKDIYSDGLRVRMNSGYGQYHYSRVGRASLTCGSTPGKNETCSSVSKRFEIDVTYTDVLVGYHMRLGALTAKAFAGASMVSHSPSQHDPKNRVTGMEYGATGGLEFWLNVGDNAWTSLDLNYTTAHETGAARWRGGWRVLPTLSVGPEARYDRNAEDGAARAGLFVRYEWFGGEISAAAGVAGSMTGSITEELQPYATINVLTQY